jgi:hypothetical protein
MMEEFDIKMIDNSIQLYREVDMLIQNILASADYFEYKNNIKPTVFMSMDIRALVLQYYRDALSIYAVTGKPDTICGYDVQYIQGKGLLYLGYKIGNPFCEE